MLVKYNTGKVIIGSCYERPLPRESDTDMLRLQQALLPAPCSTGTYLAADLALYVVSAIALVVIVFV